MWQVSQMGLTVCVCVCVCVCDIVPSPSEETARLFRRAHSLAVRGLITRCNTASKQLICIKKSFQMLKGLHTYACSYVNLLGYAYAWCCGSNFGINPY